MVIMSVSGLHALFVAKVLDLEHIDELHRFMGELAKQTPLGT